MIRFVALLYAFCATSVLATPELKTLISAENSPFRRPSALTIGVSGMIYVADTGNNRLVAVDTSGAITNESSKGNSGSELRWPVDVTVGPNGRVYVADSGKRRIVEFSRLLEWKGELTVEDESETALEPHLIASSPAGDLYVYESDNGQLLRYNNFYAIVARLGGQAGKQFGLPIDLGYSSKFGLLWIDQKEQRLYKCDAFLTEPVPCEAFGSNLPLYGVSVFDSTLFGLSDSCLFRLDDVQPESLGFTSAGLEISSVHDIQIAASSRTTLYILNVRRGTLQKLYWP